jgi:hypothetical protein
VVNEQEIIAAPADATFFSILDVRSNRQRSLQSSLSYTRTAESMGDVLGGALIRQSQLNSTNLSSAWGNLNIYDLAGIGYRVAGLDRKVVIILHYPDKSASKDIEELKRRMSEYSVTVRGLKTPRLSDLFDIGNPAATVYAQDSVLKVELRYKSDTPITLWSDMVIAKDFGFLMVFLKK